MADEPTPQETVERITEIFGDGDPDGKLPTDDDYEGGSDSDLPLEGEPDEVPVDDDEGDDADPEDEPEDDGEAEDDAEEDADAEDEDDDEGDSDDPWKQTRKVKVDGEEIEVTPEEALRGFQRQAAFTKKTQELADHRRNLDAEIAQTGEVRQRYAQNLELLEVALSGDDGTDWDKLRSENPKEFARQWGERREREKQLSLVRNELNRVREEAQKESEENLERHLKNELQLLHEVIPEWADVEGSKEERGKVAAFAEEEFGFTMDQLAQIPDHRLIVLLRESMMYRELKESADKKRSSAGKSSDKPLKPGTRANTSKSERDKKAKGKRVRQSRNRLKKTGRDEDAAKVFFDLLDDEE